MKKISLAGKREEQKGEDEVNRALMDIIKNKTKAEIVLYPSPAKTMEFLLGQPLSPLWENRGDPFPCYILGTSREQKRTGEGVLNQWRRNMRRRFTGTLQGKGR